MCSTVPFVSAPCMRSAFHTASTVCESTVSSHRATLLACCHCDQGQSPRRASALIGTEATYCMYATLAVEDSETQNNGERERERRERKRYRDREVDREREREREREGKREREPERREERGVGATTARRPTPNSENGADREGKATVNGRHQGRPGISSGRRRASRPSRQSRQRQAGDRMNQHSDAGRPRPSSKASSKSRWEQISITLKAQGEGMLPAADGEMSTGSDKAGGSDS